MTEVSNIRNTFSIVKPNLDIKQNKLNELNKNYSIALWESMEDDYVKYDLNERIVGTWIDGKPLYEKTIIFNDVSANVDTVILEHNIENVDMIFPIDAFIRSITVGGNGKITTMPLCNEVNNLMIDDTNVKWLVHNYSGHGGDLHITLRYTKTID